ncbi:MAG: C40 family peptidase [Cytophagales bacterium]|nr:C40 family peptidase [Cytophagales bacterium]
MERVRYCYVMIVILVGIFSCDTTQKDVEKRIHEIRHEFAPDGRVAIFDITTKGSNPIILEGETNLEAAKGNLLLLLKKENIEFMDQISLLPDENIGEEKYALINISVANLRGRPKHSAELVTQALLGTPVNLLKKRNGWYLIQTPDKYIAWITEGSLERMDQFEREIWRKKSKIIYLKTYGYSFDREKNERVSDLVAGNTLVLEQEMENEWLVTYPDGRQAVIPKSEASTIHNWDENIQISASSISQTAKDLMGIPYLWGGTSTKGLDCSGFTKTVYLLHGLVIPRDASQQVCEGELIDVERDFSNLAIGDLLFFGNKNKDRTESVVHVGLWLGNDQFIHASGDVHISSMDSLSDDFDRYNFSRYLRTKRYIGSGTAGINRLTDIYSE